MVLSELFIVVVACAAGLGIAARVAGDPPRREEDTAWVAQFVPGPTYEFQMTPEAYEEFKRFTASAAFGEAQMRGALAVMHDPEAKRARGIARAALKEAGRRAEPMLLESIRDWRYPPPPEPSHPDSPHPWDFAAERLATLGARQLVPLLLAAGEDGRIPESRRVDTTLYIAAVGAEESVGPTLRALSDPDGRIRDRARIGIGWALMYGNLGPEMRAAIFEPLLERTMESPVGLTRMDDVHALLRVDRARAIAAFMTDEMLSTSNPRLGDVLMAFTYPPAEHVMAPGEQYRPIAVAPERLWALWRGAQGEGPGPRKRGIAGIILQALALSDPEEARPVAERLFAEGGESREGAIPALMIIENLPVGSQALRLWEAKSPGSKAPRPILHVDAVEKVILYQTLGGLAYFLEVHDDWRLATDGFQAMGLPQCADALEWVASFYFGPSGPPADRNERERVLMNRGERTERENRLLASHEQTVEEAAPSTSLRIFQYMREHRALFEHLKPRVEPERP